MMRAILFISDGNSTGDADGKKSITRCLMEIKPEISGPQ